MKPLSPLRAFCLRPVTLSATDTPRLEARLRSILAAGANRRTGRATRFVALSATVGLAVCAGIVRPDARAVPPANRWTQTVDGVTIELLAISDDTAKPALVFKPDGTRMPSAAYIGHYHTGYPRPKNLRDVDYMFQMYDTGADIDTSAPVTQPKYLAFEAQPVVKLRQFYPLRTKSDKQISMLPFSYEEIVPMTKPLQPAYRHRLTSHRGYIGEGYIGEVSEAGYFNNFRSFSADATDNVSLLPRFPIVHMSKSVGRAQKMDTVRFKVATGSWTSGDEWQTPDDGIARPVPTKRTFVRKMGEPTQFYRGFQLEPKTKAPNYEPGFSIFTQDKDMSVESRVIAIDRRGREHAPVHGGEDTYTRTRYAVYTFVDLTINDVQTLRRQTRPFRTVTFTDIPLAPRK